MEYQTPFYGEIVARVEGLFSQRSRNRLLSTNSRPKRGSSHRHLLKQRDLLRKLINRVIH